MQSRAVLLVEQVSGVAAKSKARSAFVSRRPVWAVNIVNLRGINITILPRVQEHKSKVLITSANNAYPVAERHFIFRLMVKDVHTLADVVVVIMDGNKLHALFAILGGKRIELGGTEHAIVEQSHPDAVVVVHGSRRSALGRSRFESSSTPYMYNACSKS